MGNILNSVCSKLPSIICGKNETYTQYFSRSALELFEGHKTPIIIGLATTTLFVAGALTQRYLQSSKKPLSPIETPSSQFTSTSSTISTDTDNVEPLSFTQSKRKTDEEWKKIEQTLANAEPFLDKLKR